MTQVTSQRRAAAGRLAGPAGAAQLGLAAKATERAAESPAARAANESMEEMRARYPSIVFFFLSPVCLQSIFSLSCAN